jgi:DNA repair exonuclease SbcCD ATPase subunit
MMTTLIKKVSLIAAAIFLYTSLFVVAEARAQDINGLENKTENALEQSTEGSGNGVQTTNGVDKDVVMCENLQTSVNKLITQLESKRDKSIQNYNKKIEKWNEDLEKLDQEGTDTSDVRADIATLEQKITKLETDYNIFIDSLVQAQTISCETPDVYFEALADALPNWKVVINDQKDIDLFIKDVITPKIKALKNGNVVALRCEKIALQFDKQIALLTKQKDSNSAIYEKRKEILLARMDKLDLKGADTSIPRAMITELDTKIADLATSHDDLIVKMQTAKDQECTDPVVYKESLKELKAEKKVINGEKRDINKFISDINKAIAEAKKSIPKNGNGNGDTDTEGNGNGNTEGNGSGNGDENGNSDENGNGNN